MDKVKAAVIGTGYLGRQHARVLSQLENVELVGVVDKNPETARAVAAEFSTRAYDNHRALSDEVSAVSLATPTREHASIGIDLLTRGVDVLVEKPIASSLAEADALIEAANRHRRILQVGHLERFNPAVVAARELLTTPLFFEVHRLGVFTARSLDIDVVSDLMIHDLDLVLDFVGSPVERVNAVGLPILTDKVDIANARLEFANGCVANVTASRVSTEKVRKLRFFQKNQYVSLDFSRQDVVVLSVENRPAGEPPLILPRRIETARMEPLKAELESFVESVRAGRPPAVSAESSRAALALAHRVTIEIQEHANRLSLAPRRPLPESSSVS